MSAPMLTLDSVILSCRESVEAGCALHWLVPRQKRPILAEWSTAPVNGLAALRASHRPGANIGIRLGQPSKTDLGYLYLIDLDIRDPSRAAEAWAHLEKLLPNCHSLPTVQSGSGGESRHLYFFCETAFPKTKLAKSDSFKMVFDAHLNREVKKRDWEIDLYGTGAQAVLPPSIHPDTGLPYRWLREIEWDMVEIGVGPVLTAEQVQALGAAPDEESSELDDDDDLIGELRSAPLVLEDGEVESTIADLPDDWVEDRDQWVTVGAALHHQFQGSQIGFDLWCEWSRQSAKFDMKTQKSVWKSFRGASNPTTFRSLIKAAQDVRLQANLPALIVDSVPDTSDLDDLFGEPSIPAKNTANQASLPEIDPNWTSYLDRDSEGHPKSCLHNVALIVKNDVRTHGVIAFNEFKQRKVLVNPPKRISKKRDSAKPVVNLDGPVWEVNDPVNGAGWIDNHMHALRAMIEAPTGQGGYGLRVTDRDIKAAVDIVADVQRYHPVKNYLAAVEWDGVPRMDTLFVKYLGSEDTAYHREAARLMLVGAVSRVMEPGHKFDFVPILEGAQGKRKSSFIRILGRDWFSELSGDFSDPQKAVEQISGFWIIEIPELQGFSRADANDLKAFLSRTTERARRAFAHNEQDFARQCIFIGSTNDDEYLRDHTGGRRFWPIKCGLPDGVDIDTDELEREIDQIWAEAYAAYVEMRRTCKLKDLPLFMSSSDAKRDAKIIQESRRIETAEDTYAAQIQEWLDQPIGVADGHDDLDAKAPQKFRNVVTAASVWTEMFDQPMARFGAAEQTKIGRALARLEGWERKPQVRHNGNRVRAFVRRGTSNWREML